MSVNVRFTTGKGVYTKAWIYERASSRGTCVICKTESHDNILIRHKEPKKIIGDTHICHKCLVLISSGVMVFNQPDPPKKKRKQSRPGRPKKKGPKAGTKPQKFKCKYCGIMIAKANVAMHMRSKHPDTQYVQLIDNLIIEDNTDAKVGRTKADASDKKA